MPRYIQFATADGESVLVEMAEERLETSGGVVKAGLVGDAAEVVAQARVTFEAAIMDTVRRNAEGFIQRMNALSTPPDEAEISFGIKATGEVGNAAIVKGGAEAAYTVTLKWKKAGS
jgi:hypothetical protein